MEPDHNRKISSGFFGIFPGRLSEGFGFHRIPGTDPGNWPKKFLEPYSNPPLRSDGVRNCNQRTRKGGNRDYFLEDITLLFSEDYRGIEGSDDDSGIC